MSWRNPHVPNDATNIVRRKESNDVYDGGFLLSVFWGWQEYKEVREIITKSKSCHRALGCVLKYLIASGTDKKFCGAFVLETQNSVINFSFKFFLIRLSNPKLATKWSNSLKLSGADGIVFTTLKILSRTSAAGKYPADGIVQNLEDGKADFDDRDATELKNLDIAVSLVDDRRGLLMRYVPQKLVEYPFIAALLQHHMWLDFLERSSSRFSVLRYRMLPVTIPYLSRRAERTIHSSYSTL